MLSREMTQESSTISHLSVAMTTKEVDWMQTTSGNNETSSLSSDGDFYFPGAVIFIGLVGTAGNALILYALVVSKQHKKHMLIVNQNALDLFSSFFLVIVYSLKPWYIPLTSASGYWLCITLLSENLIWWGTNGSVVNLAAITVDRYLKVVHPFWSRKHLRPWVIYSAMAFAWFVGIVYNTIAVFFTTAVIDGNCYAYTVFEGDLQRNVFGFWYIGSFYVIILIIFIFCYGRILVAIRRQARVMASHSTSGSNTAQTQISNQIQANVIKTMIFVSVFFAITWLPFNVYTVFQTLDDRVATSGIDWHYDITMLTAFCYTSINPFIYATKFDPARKVLRGMIPCKKTVVQPTDGPVNPAAARINRTGQECKAQFPLPELTARVNGPS